MFSRVILIILSLIAIGLYIRVILPPAKTASLLGKESAQMATPGEKSASVEAPAPVPSSNAKAANEAASVENGTAALEPLPAEQMRLVLETLAPELMRK